MRPKILAPLVVAALALGACGDDSGSDEGTGTGTGDDTAESGTAGGDQPVQTRDTELGEVLTTADGLTLYGFTQDTEGTSTCEDDCAATWPPLVVDSEELPSGMDPDVFRVTTRPDGTFQLAAGEWPLYLFAGDTAPGDTNGQGSGGVWFVVTPEGELRQGDAATGDTENGDDTDDEDDTEDRDDTQGGDDTDDEDSDSGTGGY